ncbi:hypothetical protein GCM10007858_04760 [Bradyrhizobium liaoningense]|nr:hypothetical protein GCM10007858_04760 [Bradyrhizobium liaoningense]
MNGRASAANTSGEKAAGNFVVMSQHSVLHPVCWPHPPRAAVRETVPTWYRFSGRIDGSLPKALIRSSRSEKALQDKAFSNHLGGWEDWELISVCNMCARARTRM